MEVTSQYKNIKLTWENIKSYIIKITVNSNIKNTFLIFFIDLC